ncbi:MAG: HlyD family efflux transporter periplasmic adaptor subunit [Planctomycetota bacterium]
MSKARPPASVTGRESVRTIPPNGHHPRQPLAGLEQVSKWVQQAAGEQAEPLPEMRPRASSSDASDRLKRLDRLKSLGLEIARAETRREAWKACVNRLSEAIGGLAMQLVVLDGRRIDVLDSRWGWLALGNELRECALRDARTRLDDSAKVGGGPTSIGELVDRVGTHLRWRWLDSQGELQAIVLIRVAEAGDADVAAGGDIDDSGCDDPAMPDVARRLSPWIPHVAWLIELIRQRPRHRSFWGALQSALPLGRRPGLTIGCAASIMLAMALIPVPYRVSCNATIQPYRPRVVASPFEATLLKTHVRPGQVVAAGDLLLQLDGRPLKMELAEIEAKIDQRKKDYTVALATRKVAEAQAASLEQKRLSLRRDLLRGRLQKLDLRSPRDGVVLGSDLDRFVGSPLTTGQSLMEIAMTRQVVVDVEIPAFERRMISRQAPVRIRMDAAGGRSIWTTLQSIEPSTQVREDENVFLARAEIANDGGRFRPGMKGDATVQGPYRPWVWSSLRPAWERALWWVGY